MERRFHAHIGIVMVLLLVTIALPVVSARESNETRLITTGDGENGSVVTQLSAEENQTIVVTQTPSDGSNDSVVTQTLAQENETGPSATISSDTENSTDIAQMLAQKMVAWKDRANLTPKSMDEQNRNVRLANRLSGKSGNTPGSTGTESYTYVTQWGTQGQGFGQFDEPYGVAVDTSGNVYVAEYMNSRIQKFSSHGTFITSWGRYGTGDGQFNGAFGVAVDASGNVYVTELWGSRIQKFNSNGFYITQWGSYGTGNGQFNAPTSVAVDNVGNVYVVDTNNLRVQKFSSSGTYITQWEAGKFPVWIAADTSGHVYVSDAYGKVSKCDSSTGEVLSTLYGFNWPIGVAVDAQENVYVVDGFNYRIQKFDSKGLLITQWGERGTGDGQFNYPECIAVDAKENVYVTDFLNNRIQVFNRTMTVTPEPLTYSITAVGNPGFPVEDVSDVANSCSNIVDQRLGEKGLKWKRIFRYQESGVSRGNFGIDGGGLNEATFHYHVGHGSYELINPFNWGKTTLVLSNGQWLYANDVKEKWGNKNKWVYLHSCIILDDPTWGAALNTSHGIFGFKTEVKDCGVINQFLDYATEDDMSLFDSFYTATNRAYGSDTTAAVIFHNSQQAYGDHFPGHGTVQSDGSPEDRPFTISWQCGRLL